MTLYHDGTRVDGDTTISEAYWKARKEEDKRVAENNKIVKALGPRQRNGMGRRLFQRVARLARIAQ